MKNQDKLSKRYQQMRVYAIAPPCQSILLHAAGTGQVIYV